MAEQVWNADLYQTKFGFVPHGGQALIELLDPKPGMRVLDLGCGDGKLTAQIAETGAEVIGCDYSEEMLSKAREQHPAIRFEQADGTQLAYDNEFDAVFSNAAIHWMRDGKAVAAGVSRALKNGGRFIAEFGGKDNVAGTIAAVSRATEELGFQSVPTPEVWYFPSEEEFSAELSAAGFEISYITRFERPSEMSGESGFLDWLQMFGTPLLKHVPEERRSDVVRLAEDYMRPTAFVDDTWIIDYVRLRLVAQKVG
jgi:ubiquinone/menaquinone biosynthesis C-methylase UbiE